MAQGRPSELVGMSCTLHGLERVELPRYELGQRGSKEAKWDSGGGSGFRPVPATRRGARRRSMTVEPTHSNRRNERAPDIQHQTGMLSSIATLSSCCPSGPGFPIRLPVDLRGGSKG